MASNEATDSGNEAPTTKKPEINLNAREQELFMVAMMYCLKSGRPQIDYDKFKEMGSFNTLKTAQNTWGKIKSKLPVLETEEGDDGAEAATKATPKTPKSAKAPPKKRAAKKTGEGDDGEAETTPAKKQRKSPAKKKVVAGPGEEEREVKDEGAEEE